MGHRAKHRHAALLRRAAADRTIKTDLNPDGSQNAAYAAAKASIESLDQTKSTAAQVFQGLFQRQ